MSDIERKNENSIMTHICRAKNENDRFYLEHISGDCLEGAGLYIPHGGYAIMDKDAEYKIGDLVHCNKISGQISGYLKQLKSIKQDCAIVTTNYTDESRNFEFEPEELLGVVTEVYSKLTGKLIYKRM